MNKKRVEYLVKKDLKFDINSCKENEMKKNVNEIK